LTRGKIVTFKLPPGYRTTQLQGISDLTVLANVKPGFVPDAFERETLAERLKRVLTTLNAVRQARESSLRPSPFPDSIGRFGIIHFFRFALLPQAPESLLAPSTPAPARLLLNVTFDGGWEPYMRVIWGPLGTLLDLIFCHCEDYPYAFESSYEQYVAWVRSREVTSQFFYTDSPATIADSRYLAGLQQLQLAAGGRASADAESTRFALKSPESVLPTPYAAQLVMRVLASLHALKPLFPRRDGEADQEGFLLRFARDLLADLRGWVALGHFDPGGPLAPLVTPAFVDAKDWLMQTPVNELPPSPETSGTTATASPPARAFSPERVQAGIAAPYPEPIDHGALLLLAIADAATFRDWLANTRWATAGNETPGDGVFRNLALTYPGLRRLGVPPDVLAKLPRELVEGMEARAGVLGDVRGNHPQQWNRPQGLHDERPIELSVVHVVAQLRTRARDDERSDGTHALPRLKDLARTLANTAGLRLLHIQPMQTTDPAHRGHFDLADGLSQPRLDRVSPAPAYFDDQVKPGELFLGYPNARDRNGAVPAPDALLDDGSFLVVRKLRQHVDRWQRVLDRAAKDASASLPAGALTDVAALKAKLLGRTPDGDPLVAVRGPGGNDFDYRHDAEGLQCPFQSHVRRANPRTNTPGVPVPRIARRGMSYGPRYTGGRDPAVDAAERGVVFMAYNASIAEQFEVIQRWLAGGNSTGVASTQDDPLVGVPEAGRERIFRCIESRTGEVLRIDLGAAPLVSLEWGLYAFAPSLPALQALGRLASPPAAAPPLPATTPGTSVPADRWPLLLEDTNAREAAWGRVRQAGGVLHAEGYGWLVSDPDTILAVLRDDGTHFTARGYGKRFEETLGPGYLGEDDVPPSAGHAQPYVKAVNDAVVTTIDETSAFEQARRIADTILEQMLDAGERVNGAQRCSVDLVALIGLAIANACKVWFGVPDGIHIKPGLRTDDPEAASVCPGHFLSVSRYIFSPWPAEPVRRIATQQGASTRTAVLKWLQATESEPAGRGPLTKAIVAALDAARADMDAKGRIVGGVIVGFPATVFGNLFSVLRAWSEGSMLWEQQLELGARDDRNTYDAAHAVLRAPLLATMAQATIPYVIWRKAARACKLQAHDVEEGAMVVLGLGAAMRPAAGRATPNDRLMFGGEYGETVHACPGYGLALGFMLGLCTALLNKGILQRQADPRVLTLVASDEARG
jgi:deferrochelatase/peroxidase EfeB